MPQLRPLFVFFCVAQSQHTGTSCLNRVPAAPSVPVFRECYRFSQIRLRPLAPSCHETQGGDTTGKATRVLVEDVHDAIFDMVELIRTFQSKHKLSRLFLSTLFKRRQDELDAVVDRAIMRLQVGGVHIVARVCTFNAFVMLNAVVYG